MPARPSAGRFDAALKDDPDVARWSTYVGRGAIRFYLPLNVQLPNDFFAQAVIVAKDVAARERLRAKLEKRPGDEFPNLVARVSPLELGPPVGWPVQYRVSGPDIAQVREIAFKLAQVVAGNPKTDQINFDWIEPAREVRIRIDQDEARLLGLSSQALAGVLNTVMSGSHDHAGARRHLSGRCRGRARPTSSACRLRHCGHCRFRCPTGAQCRSASSRHSNTRRIIPWSGGATGSRP